METITSKKMAKKEKTIMWVGICLIVFVVLIAFLLVGLPLINAQINQCDLFTVSSSNSCQNNGLAGWGLVALISSTPAALIGILLVTYSILKWKKVEKTGAITALVGILLWLIFNILCSTLLFN